MPAATLSNTLIFRVTRMWWPPFSASDFESAFHPRWTPENRPVVDGSKPASGERPKHESSNLSPLKDQAGDQPQKKCYRKRRRCLKTGVTETGTGKEAP